MFRSAQRFLVRRAARLTVVAALTAATAIPLAAAHADAAMTVTGISSSDFTTTNAAASKPTLTVHGTNIPMDASLQLTRTDAPPTDPNALPATTTVTAQPTGVTSDGTTWTGKADLAHVSAGTYSVALVEGQTSAACTCTFAIASAGPPSPGPVVYPSKLAQGSSGTLKIPDDGAAAGAAISFSKDSGVSASGPARWGTSTECGTGRCILVPVQVAADAKLGQADDVIVTNLPASSNDTANVGKCGGCLGIDAAPTLDSVDPATLAQGAATTLTIKGSNFADKVAVTFGTGITATDKPTVTGSSTAVPVKVAAD